MPNVSESVLARAIAIAGWDEPTPICRSFHSASSAPTSLPMPNVPLNSDCFGAAGLNARDNDCVREENRVHRAQLGERRVRLTDHQRRRLAAKAKRLGRKLLAEVATIVTSETLLVW